MARQRYKEWTENEDNLAVVRAWARAGKTDQEIASSIGVSRSTFSAWKAKSPVLMEALSVGKEMADRLVEDSLFTMTRGRTVTVKKTFKLRRRGTDQYGKQYEEEYLEQGEDEVYVEPDIKAIIFWLKNRRPEEWKEKIAELEADEDDGKGILVLTPKVIKELKEEIEGGGEDAGKEKRKGKGARGKGGPEEGAS